VAKTPTDTIHQDNHALEELLRESEGVKEEDTLEKLLNEMNGQTKTSRPNPSIPFGEPATSPQDTRVYNGHTRKIEQIGIPQNTTAKWRGCNSLSDAASKAACRRECASAHPGSSNEDYKAQLDCIWGP
jgi:hypothetical protein